MRYALFLTLTLPALAQVTTGSITGLVSDPSDRVVVNATVTVSNASRSLVRHTRTDTSGCYRFVDLPPSSYRLQAEAAGFAATQPAGIVLPVDSNVQVDFRLALPAMRESVSVQVRSLPVGSSELGMVLEPGRIETLPLNRRDFLQLAMLTPGVLPPVQDSELSTRGSFAMHANGGREEFNNFLLDGVDNNDYDVNRYVLQPSVDSIQEFKIATNNYSAEYGRSAAGQVNVITRSGGNDWHGFADEYLRNRVLDARNFFDGGNKPEYIRNQFGAGIGGPIVKDRSFIFMNFENLEEHTSLTRVGSVPTAPARAGDLSSLGGTVSDPFTGDPFPSSKIPASRISPLAAKLLDLYPQPNLAGETGNFLGQPVGTASRPQFNIRADHTLSATDQLTLRYSYGRSELHEPYAEQSDEIPGFGDVLREKGHNAMASWVRVISPRTVNSVLLGFNRALRQTLPQNSNVDVNKLWGVNWLPTRPADFGYPSVNTVGYSAVGDVSSLPIDRAANTYQLTDNLTILRGSHALKFGAEFRRQQHNGIADIFARGSMTFSGALSGSGIGDLLLGYPTFGIQSQLNNTQTLRSTASNVYVQDDWKLSRTLTLNLGLRYEYNTPSTDPTNRMSVFSIAQANLVRVGSSAVPRAGYSSDWNNFAPRIGFAWSANDRMVVRGGYGVYYDSSMAMINTSLYFNPPYFTINVFFPSETSLLTLANPFPSDSGFTPPASLSSLSPDLTTGYLQQWNLNVQRQLGAGTLSVAYSGSKGTHLIRSRDINQPPPAAGALEDRLPFPGFSNILYAESGANSNFNSLNVSFSRPLTRGVSVLAVYTFSKSIDDTSAFLGTIADKNFPQDSRNFRAERAVSSFDMPHRAAIAYVWRIPGHNWLTRNYEQSGIIVAQSGQPATPILSVDNSNTGNTGGTFGSDRPNLLRNPAVSNPGPNGWFDTTAFATPAPYTFGNAGRNIIRGPGLFTADASVMRRFAIRESWSLVAEFQAFNLLNRANFNLPELYADQLTFGRIFSAKAPRQIQFALRLTF